MVDAAGPEVLGYEDVVRLVRAAVGSRSRIVHWPRGVVLALWPGSRARRGGTCCSRRKSWPASQASLLVSAGPPLGTASFRSWVAANGEGLGRGYVSELARELPAVRSPLMARSELTVDLGSIRRNARRLLGARREASCGPSSRPTATGTAPPTSGRAALEAGAIGLGVATLARRGRSRRRSAGADHGAVAGSRPATRGRAPASTSSAPAAPSSDWRPSCGPPEGRHRHGPLGPRGAGHAGPRGRRGDEPLRLRRLRRRLHSSSRWIGFARPPT